MCIKIKFHHKEYTFEETIQVKDLLNALSVSPESCLVVKDGEILSEQDWLHCGDTAEIIPVISGG